MSWHLHHVNVPAPDLQASIKFYEQILGMNAKSFPSSDPSDRGIYKEEDVVITVEDEDQGWPQVHLQVPNPNAARDNNWHINPIAAPHVAYRVNDIEAVKRELDRKGVYYADAASWALRGAYQIYFYDPALNIVEVNQRID